MSKKQKKNAKTDNSTTAPAQAETAEEKKVIPPEPAEPAEPANTEAATDAEGDEEKAKKTALLKSHPAKLDKAIMESLSRFTWTDDEFANVDKYWKSHDKATVKAALKYWECMFIDDARERHAEIRQAREVTPEHRMENVKRWCSRNGNVNFILRHSDTEADISGETFIFTRYAVEDGATIGWNIDRLLNEKGDTERLASVFFGEKAQKICFSEEEDVSQEEVADKLAAEKMAETEKAE